MQSGKGWFGRQTGLTDRDFVGAHIAKHVAGLLVQKVKVKIIIRQPMGQVLHLGQFGLQPVALIRKGAGFCVNRDTGKHPVIALNCCKGEIGAQHPGKGQIDQPAQSPMCLNCRHMQAPRPLFAGGLQEPLHIMTPLGIPKMHRLQRLAASLGNNDRRFQLHVGIKAQLQIPTILPLPVHRAKVCLDPPGHPAVIAVFPRGPDAVDDQNGALPLR